jgi:hypothetical protein
MAGSLPWHGHLPQRGVYRLVDITDEGTCRLIRFLGIPLRAGLAARLLG